MNETIPAAAISSAAPRSYTLWQLIAYFLRLGALGFGGPVALAGHMDRDLVERRQWFTEADYKEGLALAQLEGNDSAGAHSLLEFCARALQLSVDGCLLQSGKPAVDRS